MKNKIYSFIKKWNEFLPFLIGLFIWIIFPPLIRMLDPTAGVYDSGVLQILVFAMTALFLLIGISRLAMKLAFPKLEKWLDEEFAIDLYNLNTWQKTKLSFSVFFAFLFIITLLVRTL